MSFDLFYRNSGITYTDSPYVAENPFLTAAPEEAPLPSYEENAEKLPRPIWDGHDDVLVCYDYCWRTAFGNLRQPTPGTAFVSNFIDTAFNGFLFMWDSAFIVQFGRYGKRVFDFQKTLDNFYSNQHRDGFISREIYEAAPGERFARDDISSTGPNVLPWAEWEYYRLTGDRKRLAAVFPALVAYHLWLREHHTWKDGTYYTTGLGSGMDNQPRLQPQYNEIMSHGHMTWMDTCAQQVLSAKLLVAMAEELGRADEDAVCLLREEQASLTAWINEHLWSEQDGFYCDAWRDGTLNRVKSVGAYWALLADIVPPERLGRFVAHLEDPAEFKRPHRVPSLSADHPKYSENGDYWKGSVWAPTNYMVMTGLAQHGYEQLAYDIACNNIENVVEVFDRTGTVWENYSAEHLTPGTPAKDKFVGWSGIYPIAILPEYVFGIRPDAAAGCIEWHVRRTERHGMLRYPFAGGAVDLVCEARADAQQAPVLHVKTDVPLDIALIWDGEDGPHAQRLHFEADTE